MCPTALDTQVDAYRAQANDTVAFFERRSVAIFPARLRHKGSYVERWPEMPAHEAIATTRRAMATHRVNLAGRTGGGAAVFDLDAKGGVDPSEMLPVLMRLCGRALIAVVRTSRGYHLWVQVAEPVGNGYCGFLGGEIFSGAHLAMLPPSLHPDGHEYTWHVAPREPEAAVDLKALGLIPDKRPASPRNAGESKLAPASTETQEEFARLMAEAGVARFATSPQALTLCPWHPDRSPSLSINWNAAVFCCFSEHCGVRGGLESLRRRVRGNTPGYRQMPATAGAREAEGDDDHSTGDKSGCSDADAATNRLAAAVDAMGFHDKARATRECRKFFRVGKCGTCARTPAFPISCGHPLCARCMPGRLAADWARHRASMPARLNIFLLRPRGLSAGTPGVLRTTRARLAEWRKRTKLPGGIYGVRLDGEHGAVVMLAVPSHSAVPASSRAFDVSTIAVDRSPVAFLRLLQAHYVEEAQSWHSTDELEYLLSETKGRRRFQGFGAIYGEETQHEQHKDVGGERVDENGEAKAEARRALGRISGGSYRAKGDKGGHACPFCGGRVDLFPFAVPASEVEQLGDHWLWRGAAAGPPEGRRHAR